MLKIEKSATFMLSEKRAQAGQSSQGGEDVISDLAEDVMNLILTRLPIRDAVRTSILSKKWRYKWVSIPDIVFDEDCMLDEPDEAQETKHAHVVDQVLLHHVGPICKFSCMFYVLSCSHIDRWIVFLSRNEIKKLIIKVSEDYYDVPSSIFYCQELCHLELFNCKLKVPPTFKGFQYLTVLNLEDFDIQEDAIARLISKSPLLERLTLKDFDFDSLNIHAPNLRYLDIKGTFQDLSLGSSPLLTVVSIHLSLPDQEYDFEQGETCSLIQFTSCSHRIEKLVLKGDFLQFLSLGSVPEKLSASYDHLKYLDIDVTLNSKEILATLCILRSSPNLKELKIKCSLYGEEEDMSGEDAEFWGAQSQFDCFFGHLRIVEIFGIFGILFDMEFIRYILANAPVLETMKIYNNEDVGAEELPRILKELLRFRRASTQAEIIFLGN